MRVTNNMIMDVASININGTKVLVNDRNNQMTTQKKINRPSEDPVVAIRALRLRTNVSEVTQYYEKNIPDAESWMKVTEDALTSVAEVVTDLITQCQKGSSEKLTTSDRKTILDAITALRDEVYATGNADYAGRSIFTSYRTNCKLPFQGDEMDTIYNITEPLNYTDMAEARYYNGTVTLPQTKTEVDAIETDAAAGIIHMKQI